MMDRPDGVHVWAASQLDQWNDRDYRERMSLFNECIPFTAECCKPYIEASTGAQLMFQWTQTLRLFHLKIGGHLTR